MEQISEIKKRIKSITQIKQMTGAMQLISAIKSRKSRQLLAQAFPFMAICAETMAILQQQTNLPNNPLMAPAKKKPGEAWKIGFYIFSGDQGMAGAYNLNLLNASEDFIQRKVLSLTAEGKQVQLAARLVGLIGTEHLHHQGIEIMDAEPFPISPPIYQRAGILSHKIQDLFLAHQLDEIYFIFTRINKAMSMDIVKTRVLPADYTALQDIYEGFAALQFEAVPEKVRIEYEPEPERVLDYLMDTYLNGMVYGVLTEAYASEQTARMTAMHSATKNADDMLNDLQIKSNQARQAHITNELNEIVSGAEALKNG